uniref:Uncharacterized protein n=1 Tax=Ditylenchus dipsaci TaxID=166011 RepID=A0A915E2I7_9BILA
MFSDHLDDQPLIEIREKGNFRSRCQMTIDAVKSCICYLEKDVIPYYKSLRNKEYTSPFAKIFGPEIRSGQQCSPNFFWRESLSIFLSFNGFKVAVETRENLW